MKTSRSFFAIFVLMLLAFPGTGGNLAAQESFPDFLGDDQVESDFLDEEPVVSVYDPLEPVNRVFFEFNDVFYEWILKPVTDGYIWVMPRELRESFDNFFYNLAMPVRLLNSLLQGNIEQSGVVLERFLINSTVGVWGLADVANKEFGIEPRRADFGQTLGKWGMGEGVYILWPFLGPSNIRDSVGLVADGYTHPIPYFHDNRVLDVAYYTTNRVNSLSLNPDVYDDLKRYSVDPYVAARQAYYEYRQALINQR
ncbi:MAG: VacJ family lipoprotein [Desulforhopalus sp.]